MSLATPSAHVGHPPSLQPSAATQRAEREFSIPSLDGIRAVSFFLVFLAHVGLSEWVPGGFGVTIFFFLSGYLITTLLRLEREHTGRNSLRDFYLRRIFRILPPFYTVLILAYAVHLLGIVKTPLQFSAAASLLCHYSNYRFIYNPEGFPAGTVVYWSLAVEEHFYLAFPLLFIGLNRWFPKHDRAHAVVLLGLCALILGWRFALLLHWHAPPNRLFMASDTRVDSILFGCCLALFGNPMFDPWRGSRALWCWVLLPLGLILLVFTFTFRAEWFRVALRYSLQGLGLIPLFVTAIRYPDWGPMRILNWRVVRRVGALSYSLYLCHQVIAFAFEHALPRAGKIAVGVSALAVSLAIAELVQRFVERPTARARKRWVTTTWLRPPRARPATH